MFLFPIVLEEFYPEIDPELPEKTGHNPPKDLPAAFPEYSEIAHEALRTPGGPKKG